LTNMVEKCPYNIGFHCHQDQERKKYSSTLLVALTNALSRCARPQRGRVFQPRSGHAQRYRALVSATLLVALTYKKLLEYDTRDRDKNSIH
jgi:hypothetical protein